MSFIGKFAPGDFHASAEALMLSDLYFEHHWPPFFELKCLRRRHSWMVTLPPVIWQRDFLVLSPSEERDHQKTIIEARLKAVGSLGFSRKHDVVLREDRWFYRDTFISAVKEWFDVPLLATALLRFIRAAESIEQTLVTRPSRAQPPKGIEDRVSYTGRVTRGQTWMPEDDYILRKWFSKHEAGPHAGKHAVLTPEQWSVVLETLGKRRTRADVRARISALNHQLKLSLLVDGFLTRSGMDRYMREALGEKRVRIPNFRPRIKGRSYRGPSQQPLEGQPP